jgi:type I restriction enzyme S subunit
MIDKWVKTFNLRPLNDLLVLNQSGIWGEKGTKNDYPILRSTNIHDGKLSFDDVALRRIDDNEAKKYILQKGDIIVTKSSGSAHLIGKCCVFEPKDDKKYLFSNFTQCLRVKQSLLNPYFLFYYLNSPMGKAVLERINNTTSGLRNLNMRDYSSQPIPVPPLPTQRKIASILEKAESARGKRKEANRLTDEFLKSAFLEMFGDPVKNLKKLPVVRCGDISTHVSSGSTPLGGEKTYLADGILFIRSQNVQINRLDLSDEVHQKMKRTWVKNGDILLNITGASIGRVAYFNGKNNTANVNQHVCIIRPQKAKILPEYLSFLISIPNYQKKIFAMNAGATRQAFNFEQIKKFEIPFATLLEQQKFANLVKKVERLKEKQSGSERELNDLFNSLMQRAFRGEVS